MSWHSMPTTRVRYESRHILLRLERWYTEIVMKEHLQPSTNSLALAQNIAKESATNWLRLNGGTISPVPQSDDAFFDEILFAPMTVDERDRAQRWRSASRQDHARVLAELLGFVDALGKPRAKTEMFPGFPRPRSASPLTSNGSH